MTDGNNITWNNHEVILSLDMTNSDYLPYITKTGSDNFLEVRWIPELYPLPAHDKNEKIYLSIIATDQDDLISDPIESEITLDQHSAILDKRNYFQKFLDWFLDLFG